MRVLLVDDDSDDLMITKDAFKMAVPHAELITLNDGDYVAGHLYNESNVLPDIIFLDVNMPFKNGLECLREIRTDEKFNGIPVIMLTTSSDEKDIKTAFSNKATLFITKPVLLEESVTIFRKLFGLDWSTMLLHHDQKRFVLKANGFSKWGDT